MKCVYVLPILAKMVLTNWDQLISAHISIASLILRNILFGTEATLMHTLYLQSLLMFIKFVSVLTFDHLKTGR